LLRRAHSLSGALALGTFLLTHLWTQGQALGGAIRYDQASAPLGRHAHVWFVVELLFVYLPLLFHAGYGVSIALQRHTGLGPYPYRKSWAWLLQRVTGAIALLFIVYHVWQFRFQVWVGRMEQQDIFPALCAAMSSTWWGIPVISFGYLVGTAACIVHFCNGLSGFCFFWGLTRTRRAIRFTSWALGGFGFALFAYSCLGIVYLATGSTPMDLLR
jgi:succinate dehydrogenase/fumarate reductase cytochrome b subunit (b558 family)